MPLWRIYSHPSTFSPAQRDALAGAITDLYTNHVKLPRFYTNVLFIDLDEHHVYVGGEKQTKFVRIVAEQIARSMPEPTTPEGAAYRKNWMNVIHQTLHPHILGREGLKLELHIAETPRDLWRVDALIPPQPHSEEEKIWIEKNEAVPYY